MCNTIEMSATHTYKYIHKSNLEGGNNGIGAKGE